MEDGHCLLTLVVVTLDRVIVHGHDQEATLLPHLQNVCVVYWVCQESIIGQAVDEKLIIEGNEQVLLVTLP